MHPRDKLLPWILRQPKHRQFSIRWQLVADANRVPDVTIVRVGEVGDDDKVPIAKMQDLFGFVRKVPIFLKFSDGRTSENIGKQCDSVRLLIGICRRP